MRQVSGLYHRRGWRIDVGDDADADEVLVASIHEAMHDRLQSTTIYGCVVALLEERATRDLDESGLQSALTIQRGSTRVHEEFATWMSAVPAGWTAETLRQTFPVYARYLERAELRVSAVHGPYLAMHATQAIARACMQPAGLASLFDDVEHSSIQPGMLDRSMRPDSRLLRLEEALKKHGWGPLADWSGDTDDLSPERFADDNDPEWGDLNSRAYKWCRELLEREGCTTLPYDGHIPTVRQLRDRLGIPAGADEMPSSFVALMSVESETLVLEDPPPAVVLPLSTPLGELRAGDEGRRHLFLAIRPRQNLLDQYSLISGKFSTAAHLAVLRCQREDGTVELLEVTESDPAALTATAPVVVSIAMSSLADDTVHEQWKSLLGHHQAGVLCDLRPSVNLRGWLSKPDLTLRYSIIGVESRVGMVRVLLFRLDAAQTSRIYLAPVSRLYGSGLSLWFAESPELQGKIRRDDTLGDEALVRFTTAHILLEERLFAFTSGDTQ